MFDAFCRQAGIARCDTLAALYRACTCVVLPYRGEGFGLPPLEGMACGPRVRRYVLRNAAPPAYKREGADPGELVHGA